VKLLWNTEYILGTSIQKLDVQRDFPWLPADSQQAKDIERFRWFSDGYLALSTKDPNLIMDMRYSFLPNSIDSMWGIEIDKQLIDEGDMNTHVKYEIQREMDEKVVRRFLQMLFYEKLN